MREGCNAISLLPGLLDFFGHIDDLLDRYALVRSTDEAIKDLHKVEGVALFAIRIEVINLRTVLDGALSSQRGKRAHV